MRVISSGMPRHLTSISTFKSWRPARVSRLFSSSIASRISVAICSGVRPSPCAVLSSLMRGSFLDDVDLHPLDRLKAEALFPCEEASLGEALQLTLHVIRAGKAAPLHFRPYRFVTLRLVEEAFLDEERDATGERRAVNADDLALHPHFYFGLLDRELHQRAVAGKAHRDQAGQLVEIGRRGVRLRQPRQDIARERLGVYGRARACVARRERAKPSDGFRQFFDGRGEAFWVGHQCFILSRRRQLSRRASGGRFHVRGRKFAAGYPSRRLLTHPGRLDVSVMSVPAEAREELADRELRHVGGARLLHARGDGIERALQLVLLALDADEPDRARAQNFFLDAGHILRINPDEIREGRALTRQALDLGLHRRLPALRDKLPRFGDEGDDLPLVLVDPADRRGDDEGL